MNKHKPLPSLSSLPARALAHFSRNTFLIFVLTILVGSILVFYTLFRPTYEKFVTFNGEARKALIARNHELVKSAVEQSAGNMVRLLGSAEEAAHNIINEVERPQTLLDKPYLSPSG